MIIDTNALSAYFEGIPEALHAAASAQRLFLPLVVVGEYRYGIEGSAQPAENERKLNALIEDTELLSLTRDTTVAYGRIAHALKVRGRAIPHNDIWIASLARQHGLPILSRDVHFDYVEGVERKAW